MKRVILTLDYDHIALDPIELNDQVLVVNVDFTTKQIKKEFGLWLELFDNIWPTYQSKERIGKLLN